MTTDVMRNMVNDILEKCYHGGLYVPVISFDGQWYTIAVRSANNEPLTILQLMKDVYKQARSIKKSDMLKHMKQINLVPKLSNREEVFELIDNQVEDKITILNGKEVKTTIYTLWKKKETPYLLHTSSTVAALLFTNSTVENKEITEEHENSRTEFLDNLPENIAPLIENDILEQAQHIRFAVSWTKYKLSDLMFNLVNQPEVLMTRSRSMKNLYCLKTLCLMSISKFPKDVLNIVYAEHIYPTEELKWRNNMPFAQSTHIEGLNTNIQWYSKQEYVSNRFMHLFSLLDCHHLLTNARIKCCSTGIVEAGIHSNAWSKVARQTSKDGKEIISSALVDDLIDKQRNVYAQKTFSNEVETAMTENGDLEEANFCKLIREWYQAEDEPGIATLELCERRLNLQNWLMDKIDIGKFPPPGRHVKGIPIVMFEGLMTNIERRIQLFPFIKSGAYNVRVLGSLESENFFGQFQDLDPKGSGVLRPDDVSTAISTACELTQARFDPNRVFYMNTSRAKVYPVKELETNSEHLDTRNYVSPHQVNMIVAVVSRSMDSAKKFASKFEIPKTYDSYETFANDPEIDVVYIGSVCTEHVRLTVIMLKGGKHVLCEKPCSISADEVKMVNNLAKEKNLFFMEGLWVRCFPTYKKIREELKAGTIGDPQMVSVRFCTPVDFHDLAGNKKYPSETGGFLLEAGIYTVQFALMVYGEMPVSITAVGEVIENELDLKCFPDIDNASATWFSLA
ncbi:DHDH [Mytilus edulis]|uniref:Trans-1,2-dihydrobenzene-1,2-diol dehydrogenase n=1 Tax=Mytilus edulis TaxID=6550 RepID=A0A8S3R3V0_MYTED|nr:DHDH [Mytilus edulis]